MSTSHIATTLTIDDEDIDVECVIWYDPGVRTLSNGDPGWPDDGGIEIELIEDADGNDLSKRYRDDKKWADKVDELLWEKYNS